eukprot:7207484-Pyramimonas_sp.AAC.1
MPLLGVLGCKRRAADRSRAGAGRTCAPPQNSPNPIGIGAWRKTSLPAGATARRICGARVQV